MNILNHIYGVFLSAMQLVENEFRGFSENMIQNYMEIPFETFISSINNIVYTQVFIYY